MRFVCAGANLRILVLPLALAMVCRPITAQEDATDQERVAAERFLQVLKRRPRFGTALERVYGFHVQNDSLDEFIASLESDDDGQRQMILGLLRAQRGQQALAAEAFERAEQKLPNDAMCSFYLGRSLLAVGKTEQAAAAFERAVERKPARNEALPIFTDLGRLYGRAGQTDKALDVWKKLEALFPGDARVGGTIANTLAEEGNVDDALARYEALANSSRQEEDRIAFAIQAAEMQRRLGKNDQATKLLENILARVRPGSWLYSDVRNRIEEGFLKSGDYDSLAKYYQAKLKETDDNLALQTRLGRIFVLAGRLDEAKATLEQAVGRAPNDTEIRLALIDVLVNKADIPGAGEQFEKLAELDPDNPDYLLRWGSVVLEDEDRELPARRDVASKIWQRLADARADDAVTLSQVADRMRSIDRTDHAIALYRQAIEVDPTSPQYREYLGEYLYRLDRKDEAIEVWESIAGGDRRNRESLVRLAEVLGTFNRNDLALGAWRAAAEFDLAFAQEIRFAKKLRDASEYDESLVRLDAAEKIAETPDENEQVLRERIFTYQQAGTLTAKIAELEKAAPTVKSLRQLAMMHAAASQLTDAAEAISRALQEEPDKVDVLIVAADIADRQNRYSDAAETYGRLAAVNTRFRTNYLKRVADFRVRLGQIDQALQTCEELIDANPASPDSYQFYARTAFGAGRDDQAITALRRAMNVAPRDNRPRKMLASEFANRYRTDEAIELYWQAMRYERESDRRIELVKSLAPLYDRKAELDSLVSRIEEMGREDNDRRTTQLMLAAAHEAVEDYGAARQAIDRLLAQQPRDVALLESMVRLCDAADEVDLAAEFQERIVALADTPQNRFKLVQLQLDAEMIDIATALSERISLASDPVRLGSMIRSAVNRGDDEMAIAICREALRRDPSLWDVKLYLAQMLLHDSTEKKEASRQDAIALVDDVRGADVATSSKPPTARQSRTRRTSSSRPANYYTSPQYWTQSRYELERAYRLGRYGSSNYGYSRPTLVEARSFGHGRVISSMLQLVAAAEGKSGKELNEAIDQLRIDKFNVPPLDQITDANVLWEYRSLHTMAGEIRAKGPGLDLSKLPPIGEVKWRMAELDPEHAASSLTQILIKRAVAEAVKKAGGKPEKWANPPFPLGVAFAPERLELLVNLYEKAKARTNKSKNSSAVSLWTYNEILQHEFQLANDPERAKQFAIEPLDDDASFKELMEAIKFHLRFRRVEKADGLVDRLLVAARNDFVSGANAPSSSQFGSVRDLSQSNPHFIKRHRTKMLDAFIARSVRHRAKSRRRSTSLSDGTLQTYILTPQGYHNSLNLKAPLSGNLLSQDIVAEVAALIPEAVTKARDRSSTLDVPLELRESLETELDGAPAYEAKTRLVLAAYAHWWAKEPFKCYQDLIKLCDRFPEDVDLQIERARLASELNQPRVALDTLDTFDPLDSRMMVRKEMAAMNLASQLGDVDRARQSAERLFGMRMDTQTQLALSDQLRRLGMNSQSAAVLQRLRGGRSRDERTELSIANAFLASGDQSSAAEVAYSLLRRLNSGRSTRSNNDYYRQQAVSVLRSAKKLDAVIQRAERRVKSAPKSSRARFELAELYTAAGRGEDAEKLWTVVAGSKTNDPREMLSRASALNRSKKYKEATTTYLNAFEKSPQMFNQHYHELQNAVRQAKNSDDVFERLMTFKPGVIPGYRYNELMRMGGYNKFTDAKRKFALHALKQQTADQYFYQTFNAIPKDERDKMPGLQRLMVDAICQPDNFSGTSSTWSIFSYSGDGTVSGALSEIVPILVDNETPMKRFRKVAENQMGDDAKKPTATFLLAMLDIKKGHETDAAVDRIRELMKSSEEKNPGQQQVGTGSGINGGLLWQAGQILEGVTGIDDQTDLLVGVYRMAATDPNMSRMNSFQYSVGSRLVKALEKAGRNKEARDYLLDVYRTTDYSEQNRYNPGYGDSQELGTYYSVASALKEVDCPLDALAICRRALAEPERFEKAKRWGGGSSVEQFEQLSEAVEDEINAPNSIQYLSWAVEDLAKTKPDKSPAIELLDLPTQTINSRLRPGIQIAVEVASETEEGLEKLAEFDKVVSELAADRNDWSLSATRLIVAIATESDESQHTSAIAKTLFDQLPPASWISGEDDAKRERFRPLLGLYTPAAMALKSEREETKSVGTRLAGYLKTLTKKLGEPGIHIALSSMSGDDSESLEEFFAAIESSAKPGAPLGKKDLAVCIEIAKSAAKNGNVLLSTRALKTALGNGPPLRKLGPSDNDAFAINRNSSNQQVDDPANAEMEALAATLCDVVDAYSEATGKQLGKRKPSGEVTEADDPEATLQAIAKSLQHVVLPESQSGAVFSYAKPIVSTRQYDHALEGQAIVPESLSIALSRSAAMSGQSEALLTAIRSRLENSADKESIACVMVDVAFAAKNSEALSEALDLFEAAYDQKLPQDTEFSTPDQVRSITTQMQNESIQKSVTINCVVGTLWPMTKSSEFPSPETKKRIITLLLRTAALINSDSYTAQRHRVLAGKIRRTMMKVAADSGQKDEFNRLLKIESDSVRQQYSSYQVDDLQSYIRQGLQTLMNQLSRDGMVEHLPAFIRERSLEIKRPGYQLSTVVALCADIAKLTPEQQYDVLKKTAMGENDDDPIVHWGAFVTHRRPPEFVSRRNMAIPTHNSLPVCDKNVPLVDTLLMLADVAAELGKSESLANEFSARSQAVGDQADIASALVRLAGTTDLAKTLTSIEPTLDAIKQQIKKATPDQNDKELVFHDLSWYLIARAVSSGGLSKTKSQELLTPTLILAGHGEYKRMISTISRVRAAAGLGPAANAQPSSPLAHFEVVPIPRRDFTGEVAIDPWYCINQAGELSGTSGDNLSVLLFRYPVAGEFSFSASFNTGLRSEGHVSYGGVHYPPDRWQKAANVLALGRGTSVRFPVGNLERSEANVKGVRVSSEQTVGICNDKPFVTDMSTTSFPFVGLTHQRSETPRITDIKFEGDVKVLPEVNLIHPAMRGWMAVGYDQSLPDPQLPIGPKQNKQEIETTRADWLKSIEDKLPEGIWVVKDDVLHYKKSTAQNVYDAGGLIQYLRPLLDGETIEYSFWWEWGKTEVHPAIGDAVFEMSQDGMSAVWSWAANNPAMYASNPFGGPPQTETKEESEEDILSSDLVPEDKAWNTVKMTRRNGVVSIELNGEPLTEIPVTAFSSPSKVRPGLMRKMQMEAKVRTMKLTGDWPSELPKDWKD